MKKKVLFTVIVFFSLQFIHAQPGTLDSTFANNGILINNFPGTKINSTSGMQVLAESDSSVYVVLEVNRSVTKANPSVAITKRNINGSIDKSYGINGFSNIVNIRPIQAALQPDGKIVVIGSLPESSEEENRSPFAIFRLSANGKLDTTFGNKGFQGYVFSDFSFANATCVTVQTNGKIVVGGNVYNGSFTVARYNSNGSPDSSFSSDGKQATSFGGDAYVSSIAVQNDGKIVVAGSRSVSNGSIYYNTALIARYNINGTLDHSFGKDGKQTIVSPDSTGIPATTIALQKDGKIVLSGTSLIRINIDGTLDSTFSKDGKISHAFPSDPIRGFANALATQPDGKIVAGGRVFKGKSLFAIIRYNSDGSVDSSFSADGIQTTGFSSNNSTASSLAIFPNGKVIACGTDGDCDASDCANKFAIARFNADGALDKTFDQDGKLTGGYPLASTAYWKLKVQKDGKTVIIGSSDDRYFIARYDTQGLLDNTFNSDGIIFTTSPNTALAIQQDQKIVVSNNGLVRYNANGTPDTMFGKNGTLVPGFQVSDFGIQKDGKIVIVGSLQIDYEGGYDADVAIARYNTDGTADNTFSEDGMQVTDLGQFEFPSCVDFENDGTIVVGVSTSNFRGAGGTLVGYSKEANLTFATTISRAGGLSDGGVNSIAIQKDNKIVVIANKDGVETLYRYTATGGADNDFSEDGQQRLDFNSGPLAIQSDGKILVGGTGFELVRYNPDGSLDVTFNKTGIQITSIKNEGGNLSSIGIYKGNVYVAGTLVKAITSLGNFGVLARYHLDGIAPPVVSIKTPKNDTIFTAPAIVKIIVDAIPVGDTISKVEFFSDTTLLHTEHVYPYGFYWRNVPAGNYTITAKATDNHGFTTISEPVKISVVSTIAPTVNIIKPFNNKVIPGPSNITLQAIAKDPDGSITKVEFYVGSTLLAAVTDLPYTYVWKRRYPGNFSFTARATDNMGVITTSTVVNVTVVPNNPPTVHITNPANQEYFTTPANIGLAASAEDADGRITKVEFYNGNTLLRTEYEAPYRFTWPDVPSGNYTITAVATDNLAYRTTSAPVNITVLTPNAKMVKTGTPPIDNKEIDLSGVRITPNPVTSSLNISTGITDANKQIFINVYSALGIKVTSKQFIGSNRIIQLDVSSLSAGVYTLQLRCGDKVTYRQFVKL